MKITHIAVAASLALTSTAAFAGDAKKHDLAKAKDDAKKAALEKAKADAAKKTGKLVDGARGTRETAPDSTPSDAEKQTHARNVGAIERLQQIADATSNADLKTVVQRLSDKETKRHGLAG